MLPLGGLELCPVPPETMERTCVIDRFAPKKTKTVHRKQLPLTVADTFMDVGAQGQMLERVVVNIEKVPTGNITPFNSYAALSRSSGRSTIRLLRDFDDALFTTAVPESSGGGRETGEIGLRH